ncbi:hypothetical protein BDZ97DRAFT_102775 [Flammula alnicola]|nr:hypothetical protein BDZ97DRAFT_102775 [Flammula alnicola]
MCAQTIQPSSPDTELLIGRLVLTLWRVDSSGKYPHAVVPFPESYEIAVHDALEVFSTILPPGTETVALKCATGMNSDGTIREWAVMRPADWSTLVNPSGDTVGVFLPASIDSIPSAAETSLQSSPNTGTHEKDLRSPKLICLVRVRLNQVPQEQRALIATNSYQECLELAFTHLDFWRGSGSSHKPESVIRLEGFVEDWTGKGVWSTIANAAAFERVLEIQGEPINLRVSWSQ